MKFFAILGAFFLQLAVSQQLSQLAAPPAIITVAAQQKTNTNTDTDKFAPLRQALAAKGTGANGK